jgi:hypothetical protein
VQRRIREDAASAGAEGGEKSPERSYAGEPERQFRDDLNSRQAEGWYALNSTSRHCGSKFQRNFRGFISASTAGNSGFFAAFRVKPAEVPFQEPFTLRIESWPIKLNQG